MRRILALLMILCIFGGFAGSEVPSVRAFASDSTWRPAAPLYSIVSGTLLLGGRVPDLTELAAAEFFYAAAADARYVALTDCETDDSSLLPPLLHAFTVFNAGDISEEGAFKLSLDGSSIKPVPGDMILARKPAADSEPASEWTVLTLTADMLAEHTAASPERLPAVVLSRDSAVISPANIYTSYEYAIVRPGETVPDWKKAGSAYETGGTEISIHFSASVSAYQFWLRIADDMTSGIVSKQDGLVADTAYINYTDETLGPLYGGDSGAVWFININEGKKWISVSVDAGQESFYSLSKTFGKKEALIELRRYVKLPESSVLVIDNQAADPAMDPAAAATTAPADEQTGPDPELAERILRVTVQPRAELPKELKATGFVSNIYPENWTLEGSSMYRYLEYSTGNGVWNRLDISVGLPLLTAAQQKAKLKAQKYQVRVPASPGANIPSSKPKNYTQQKQTKAPNYKPNYKTESLKIKDGMYYCFAEAGLNPASLRYSLPSDGEVSFADALTKGLCLYLYSAENGKKSRSDYQILRFAPRAVAPDENEAFILKKGKVSLDKRFEFYGSKEKWGSFTKGDTTGYVRVKATAKYEAKTGTTKGLAASRPVKAFIRYDEDGKNVSSASLEAKTSIPLGAWFIDYVDGGEIAYGSDEGENALPLIALSKNSSQTTVEFTPLFSEEAKLLTESVRVEKNGTELEGVSFGGLTRYSAAGLRLDDTVTITVLPKDPDTCRESVYTLTVIPPLAPDIAEVGMKLTPESVPAGEIDTRVYDDIYVKLNTAPTLGTDYEIVISFRRPEEAEPFFSTREIVGYTPQGYTTFQFDLRSAISAKGAGDVIISAYIEGNAALSRGNAALKTCTLNEEDFFPWAVTLAEPVEMKVDKTLSVTKVMDRFGNDITNGAIYQWMRGLSPSSLSEAIVTNGGNRDYTLTPGDLQRYMGVMIYANGGYRVIPLPGVVWWF